MVTLLTDYELKLVLDPEILLTKNRIIQKVYELFGGLAEEYRTILTAVGIDKVMEIGAKISRGENYNGLPYVVLDYPRQFGKDDVFAIRTFFWWGNFFSITLQLAGAYQHRFAGAIESAINKDLLHGWSLSCSDNAWQHHFGNDNYRPIQGEKNYPISTFPFVKIAKKIPLEKWDEVDVFFKENFTFLINTLGF